MQRATIDKIKGFKFLFFITVSSDQQQLLNNKICTGLYNIQAAVRNKEVKNNLVNIWLVGTVGTNK